MKPKIRLKGFSGEWETHTLSEYFKKVCVKNTKMEHTTVLTNSAEHGVIPQSDFFDHAIANNKNIGGYYVVSPDDFVYNPRVSVTAPVGPINRSLLTYSGVMSPLYLVFKVNGINKDYLSIFYKTNKWHNFMKLEGNCGARFDRLSIGDEQFVKMPLTHPKDNDEQQAIADYFQYLDTLIQSTTKKIESLKQVKAASLQSMFPQEGETTPRVRFKGFEGEWCAMPLNKFAKRVTRKNKGIESTLALTISSIEGLVSQIDYFNNLVVGANIENYYLLKQGEFAYNKSYSRGYPFGSVKRLDRYEQGILSTLYIVFSITDEISSDYLTHFFDTTLWHKQVAERAEEGARNHGLLNIGADDFMSININLPKSKDEQQRIADYFTNLDFHITLQTQRLEKLKQIKSACLDNMFV